MECPNDQCFCDGSCYDNEQFNKTWEWYEEICGDLGLEYFEEFPTIGKTPEIKFTYTGKVAENIDESNWILNNKT